MSVYCMNFTQIATVSYANINSSRDHYKNTGTFCTTLFLKKNVFQVQSKMMQECTSYQQTLIYPSQFQLLHMTENKCA